MSIRQPTWIQITHAPEDVFWSVAHRIEDALLSGVPVAGVIFDYSKCFDLIPHNILTNIVWGLGMDARIAGPLRSMYRDLRRYFRVGQGIGAEFTASNGILQGCPLSVVLLSALVAVWCKAVRHEVPGAHVEAFAVLLRFVNLLSRYALLTRQLADRGRVYSEAQGNA